MKLRCSVFYISLRVPQDKTNNISGRMWKQRLPHILRGELVSLASVSISLSERGTRLRSPLSIIVIV